MYHSDSYDIPKAFSCPLCLNFYIHPRMSYKFLQLIVGAALSHALISYVYSCDEWNVADVPIWMLYGAVETLVSVCLIAEPECCTEHRDTLD